MMKSKLASVLLSVFIAFGLWLYVVNNVSQEADYTLYNVPVIMEGETVLVEDRNLMITSISADNVDLTLYGKRSDLAKVNSSNVTLKADLTKIYEPGEKIALTYNITFPSDVANNALTPVNRSPDNIYVTVEARRNKEIPVEVRWIGSTPEGFMSDRENKVLDHSYVTVVGPASVADLIEKAVIEVDLSEQRESISQNYRYILCDGEGNPVDAELITTNVENIHLDVRIRKVKEVELTLDVTYGGGATEHNTTITIEPGTIRLSGSETVLAELGDTISLGKIDLRAIATSQTLTFPVTLPDGVTNLSNVTEVTVDVQYKGLSTKEVMVQNLVTQNVPEGLEVDIIEKKLQMPDENEVRAVLRQMGKFKPAHELNCGTCGYNSCREKAIAICQGKAEASMCLPFLKDKAESFSDTIVKNTPNGLIVLNENLEVQQINDAARNIMNIRAASDVLGDQVVRILDPTPFMGVLRTGRDVRDQHVYLAEYKRYVEQSVVYDRDSHLLVCIMRDITDEESARERKESISRQTIEVADRVVDKQMRIVQEIASLLGETAAETKIALAKLKESVSDE